MAGDSDGLSGSVTLALCDAADSICLVRVCRGYHALDLGWTTVLGLKMLCRAMSHGREHPCQLCNATLLPEYESVLDHIFAKHKQYLHLGNSVMDSAEPRVHNKREESVERPYCTYYN